MPPELELVKLWLERATVDLCAAEVDVSHGASLAEDACFHCQQAVEKALKGFLVYRDVEFEWSHNIEYLLILCVDQDHSFNQWRSSAGALTEFAVRFRYPEPGPAPSLEQARGYLDVARRVYDFVLQRLPKETHPSS